MGAKTLFATLQSAGAGGYGQIRVLNAIRAGAVATGSIPWVGTSFSKGKQVIAKYLTPEDSEDASEAYDETEESFQHKGEESDEEMVVVDEQAEQVKDRLVEKPIKSKL